MVVNGVCNYAHLDKFERIDGENMKAKVARKRPSNGSREEPGEESSGMGMGSIRGRGQEA